MGLGEGYLYVPQNLNTYVDEITHILQQRKETQWMSLILDLSKTLDTTPQEIKYEARSVWDYWNSWKMD